ncbi:hypothetical protein OSTOST_03664 [Ostertagia ostertagi]
MFIAGLSREESLNDDLRNEAAIHGDILRADFIDTWQSIAGLRYVAAVCPSVEAVVKLDDDVAWNIHRTKLIVDYAIRNGHIYCAG